MYRRNVQRAALLTILLLVALFAWGCGSGAEEVTTTTVAVPSTLPPVTTGDEDPLVGTVLTTTENTPQEYVDAVAQARPVVILFYVPGGADDVRVLESVNALAQSYPEYVFLLYDHKTPDVYGDLSTLLSVNYPPELIMVDGTGTIRKIWNGYADQGTINQGLANLGGG